MDKPLANKDITYCTNTICRQRKDCFRNIDNYIYDKNENYWFSDFAEDYCMKGYAKNENRKRM